MKKILLSLLVVGGLSMTSFAQIEFYIQGDASNTEYSGSTYTVYATGTNEQNVYIDVVNKTGADDNYVVGRQRITPVATSWHDGFCWEGNLGGGICIDTSIMSADYFQMQNNEALIQADSAGEIKTQIFPNYTHTGTYTYRYYVGTLQDNRLDSIDVAVILTPLSIVEPTLTVGVQPNPANEYITIKADGFESADLKIVDVLGNVVLDSKVSGQTTIDVAEYRSGIYFVTVSTANARVSRKVVVRH